MGPDAILTLTVMSLCAAGLLLTRVAPDAILMAGLAVLSLIALACIAGRLA